LQPETYFPYFTKACLSKAEGPALASLALAYSSEWQNIVIITKSGNNNGSIVFEVETFYGSFSLFPLSFAVQHNGVKQFLKEHSNFHLRFYRILHNVNIAKKYCLCLFLIKNSMS
jgi:hypothetical protein